MLSSNENLIKKIEIAFPVEGLPLKLSVRGDADFADKEDVDYFQGKRPDQLTFESLRYAAYALNYFTERTLKQYLAPILILVIRDQFKYQPIVDTLIEGLLGGENTWARHLSTFNGPQLQIIVDWIEYYRNAKPGDYDSVLLDSAAGKIIPLLK